jgi:hypothetical protein
MSEQLTEEQIAAIEARRDMAVQHISDICHRRRRWTMTIPRRDDDRDSLFGDLCRDVKTLLAERTTIRNRNRHLQAALDDYDNRIEWHTTCQQCAHLLGSSYEDCNRIKELESALTELVDLKDNVKEGDPEEYERRKPLAWEAARKAVR